MSTPTITRRATLARVAAATLAVAPLLAGRPAHGAAPLPRTRAQGEGPFYPVAWRGAIGADLIHAAGGAVAEGRPLRVGGRVLDTSGAPLAGVRVEIWQCDSRRLYRHPFFEGRGQPDPGFRGFGALATDAVGAYEFLTIVPVAYAGRPPHIHVKVKTGARTALTTQLYVANHPDGTPSGRAAAGTLAMTLARATLPGGLAGHAAAFDFVI